MFYLYLEHFVFGGLFAAILISAISSIMGVLKFVEFVLQSEIISIRYKFYTNPFSLLLFAALEELFARAFLIGWLEQKVGLSLAFAISAFVFTVLHIPNGKVTLLSSVNLFLSGIVFGIIYVKFGLSAAVGCHYIWNLMQWTLLGFPFYGNRVGRILQVNPIAPEWKSGGQFGPEYSIVTLVMFVLAISVLISI